MKPAEHGIRRDESDFFIYTPSRTALETFLHPLRVGRFLYEPGYELARSSFDSYLLMHMDEGAFDIITDSERGRAGTDDFVLLNCYAYHRYRALEKSRVLWMHFDGPTAGPYFRFIHSRLGTVFALQNAGYALTMMERILTALGSGRAVSEPLMARYVTDVLTECALHAEAGPLPGRRENLPVEDILAYIAAHLHEPLSVGDLADRAFMSEYHFIRVFKRETGYTPYAYIINARMHAARYKLITTDMPLKELCAECGFPSVSAFCALFRRKFGCSPGTYRSQGNLPSHGERIG